MRAKIWLVWALLIVLVPTFARTPEVEDFFRQELCPPNSDGSECSVVQLFVSDDDQLSVGIVENLTFRSSTFGFAIRLDGQWQLLGAGPLVDLEVMAYSPTDPFAFENYPGIWQKVGDQTLFGLLTQVAEYFDDLYGYD
ncbi:MAG: hypothetical protein GW949_04905 [Spirochaetales bacterium]|nr:hypothetical protein [Spirochaetales bacterium]